MGVIKDTRIHQLKLFLTLLYQKSCSFCEVIMAIHLKNIFFVDVLKQLLKCGQLLYRGKQIY